ncbi:hypothetical protein [Micrococcus sp.]|uniref:hypothetical protein n=1 Tax=Micrococcus sp. TaxID=1271 RepID=UPI002A910C16|nr:hypothetical protein [Micrococcus sp.]MDY6055989.1 hypothetical protein [Micrococcus sp.]
MSSNLHGAHAVEIATGPAVIGTPAQRRVVENRTAPHRPVRTAVVPAEAVEPVRPVDGWGFSNRVMIVATLAVTAFMVLRVVVEQPTGGSWQWGTSGRGFVETTLGLLFGVFGGALTAAIGALLVLFQGGAARSVARYAVGGVVGGLVAALLVLMIFSNTAVLTIGFHVFWLLALSGLLGGLWAGLTSARR